MRDDSSDTTILKYIMLAVVFVVGLILFVGTYYQVEQNQRVVFMRFGKIQSVEGPGLHFKIPFVNSIEYYTTDNQTLVNKEPANTYTVDNQEIDVLYKLIFQIPSKDDKLIWLHTEARNYAAQLQGIALDRLKAAMGKINVSHVAEKRGEIRDTIQKTLTNDLDRIFGIKVVDFQLVDLRYSDKFRQAVEKAAEAKAGVETQIQLLEQAKKQAEQVEAKAKGDAGAKLALAEAEAKSIELKGLAEARSIEAQAKALLASPSLVELRKAERWNGVLPQQMLSGVTPLMTIDSGQLKK